VGGPWVGSGRIPKFGPACNSGPHYDWQGSRGVPGYPGEPGLVGKTGATVRLSCTAYRPTSMPCDASATSLPLQHADWQNKLLGHSCRYEGCLRDVVEGEMMSKSAGGRTRKELLHDIMEGRDCSQLKYVIPDRVRWMWDNVWESVSGTCWLQQQSKDEDINRTAGKYSNRFQGHVTRIQPPLAFVARCLVTSSSDWWFLS